MKASGIQLLLTDFSYLSAENWKILPDIAGYFEAFCLVAMLIVG